MSRDVWEPTPDEYGYDVGQACLAGHAVTGSLRLCPDFDSKFCAECGEPTITKCQNPACNAEIRGNLRESFGSWDPPKFCHACGTPYPWTQRRAEALAEAIDELDELEATERDKLKQSIPDVLHETVKTETATRRFGKAIKSAGTAGGKFLSDVLANVAAEVVARQLGLK